MSDKLSYTEDELRRLSVTEPNLKRRAQYAQMLKQAQSEMQKAKTKTFAIWVMEGDTPAKQANTFQASGEDEALKQVETYAHANGFTRFVLRALGERWGQYESRDGKNFLRMGYPDRAPSFEAPSGYGTSGKAQGAGVRKAGGGYVQSGDKPLYEFFDGYRNGKYDGHAGPFSGTLESVIEQAKRRLNGNKTLTNVSIRLRDGKGQGGYGTEVAKVEWRKNPGQDQDEFLVTRDYRFKAASAPMSKGASEVENILRQYLNKDVRVRLFYGDKNTGRDWGEEYSVMGTIGQSMGPQKVLLLVNNRRSMGGEAISLDTVVKIMVGGRVVYQHPKYNQGEYTIGKAPSNKEGLTVGVFRDGENVANFTDQGKAQRWIDYMTGKRNSKAAPAPMRKAGGGSSPNQAN